MVEEFGAYESSYFVMTVPTESDIDIRNMSDEDFSVFFHEYIHFLQDITSFYGYMGIFAHGEYIRRAVNGIYKMPKRFHVPITVEDDGDFVVLNKDIAELSLGDKGDLSFVHIKRAFIEEFQITDSFSIPELHINAVTDRGQEELILGAYAIRENMAYLLERKCTTKYRRSYDFPYQIVEILAEHMCPGKLSDDDLIALCDVSLQCSVPGYGLYQHLKAIADGRLNVKRPEDFYTFIFSQTVHFLGQDMALHKAIIKASSCATDHLLSYVRVNQLSKDYQDWVSFTFNAGVGMRIWHPYFFIEMARGKKNKDNAILKYIAKNIGSPQMVNSLGNRFQLATNRPVCRFEYLEVVRDIEKLFEEGKKKCSLRPWCEMSPDGGPVDDRCINAPWRRCNDEQLCPYGLLWRHWNLADKEAI